MPSKLDSDTSKHTDDHPSLPLDKKTWAAIAETLALSPQQTRIVELILLGKQDKEIASELGLAVPTVRTYLTRIFQRANITDRLALVLRVFEMSHQQTPPSACSQSQ